MPAELGFRLAATPSSEALPTPSDATTRLRPALQNASGGTTPAVGPQGRRLIAAAPAHEKFAAREFTFEIVLIRKKSY